MSKITLGIDIGGTSVKAAVLVDGQCLRTGQSDFYARPDAGLLKQAIRQAVGDLNDADAIGLCVPGLMDEGRTIITYSVNVPGLINLPLTSLVPSAMAWSGTRATAIANDAAATAYHIYHSRELSGRLLVLTLGTGVGGAVLDHGGRLLDVEGGTPGHLGQIDVSIPGHDVIGPDGGGGGLEGYIGVAALKRDHGSDVSAAIARFTGTEPAMFAMVRALRIAHAIYRPNHICIAGGIGTRLRHLLPNLRQMVDRNLTSVARKDYTLTCGEDDFHAARGAALLAAQK
jgi:predicted NBD/HSP70 family sugar kinase